MAEAQQAALREAVAVALGAPLIPAGHIWPNYEAADKALAALGLDDLDAFVGRMADAHERFWGSPRNRWEFQAAILKAALTATAESCDHEWVDARNSAVVSGELCVKCRAIRAGNEAASSASDEAGNGDS